MSTASIKETLLREVSTLPPDYYSEVLNFIESLKVDKPKTASGKRPRSELLGCMKGKIWMADDFNAPMELVDSEFMEYANKVLKSIGGRVWMPYGVDAQQEESAKPVKKMPKPGCMRGEIWMADDFDAPLEEFEEYM